MASMEDVFEAAIEVTSCDISPVETVASQVTLGCAVTVIVTG